MDAVAISIQGGDGMNDLISRQVAIDMLIHSDIEKRRSEQE